MMPGQAILLVEDSKALATLASRKIAGKLGCQVMVAYTLAETRDLLAQGQSFLAAVLDLNLPDAPDGDIVELVRGHGIPAIVMTGTFGEALRARLLEQHIVDYILKQSLQDYDYVVSLLERLQRNQSVQALIVDDSPSARIRIRQILASQHIRVREAGCAEEALEVLAQEPGIKVLVTDYNMPGMDGFELILRLRRQYPKDSLAVIGLSAEYTPLIAAKFLKHGANDFLPKSCSPEELISRVHHNLEWMEQVQALQQALELRNRFLGMASHDLRNPLGAVSGYATMLLHGVFGPLAEAQTKYLGLVNNAAQQMLALVNDLLDVAVIDSGRLDLQLERGSLQQLLTERAELHQVQAGQKQMSLESHLADLPPLAFDRLRLAQVIDNLLGNAIKFSPPGTPIRLTLEAMPDGARFSVQDQGPGLSPEDQQKLFGEFQRLSARPTGGEKSTGLGLAIARKIIQAHGWELEAASQPGQGATFFVTIPSGALGLQQDLPGQG